MPPSELVTIATFDDPHFAHIARSRLESENIQAVLDSEFHVAMDWLITNAVGGVKLVVHRRDAEEAFRILNETAAPIAQNEVVNEEERESGCPKCGSKEFFKERLKRKLSLWSLLLLSIPLPFRSRWLICGACDNRWSK